MSATGDFRPRLSSQAGTTLIEALVVVAITTMVALIGFPQLQQSLVALSQRQAVAVVAARLRQAHADALRSDLPVVFQASTDGQTYGVANGPAARPPPGVTVDITSEHRAIVFFGDGSSSGGRIMVRTTHRVTPVNVMADTGAVIVGGA